jgi:putative ABC transport system permease protein
MIALAMLGEAWRALGASRLRTGLTMLGMIIGVGAVVLMLAIGQGVQFMVNRDIASMGSHLFIVLAGAPTSASGLHSGAGSATTLTISDAQALAELPAIDAAAPVAPNTAQLVYGANNWNTFVYGTTPSYLQVRDWPQELFGDEDPVGKTVRINNTPFLVVGVLAVKGQSLEGREQDDTALIPVTTAQRRLFGNPFPDSVRHIMVQAKSAALMAPAEREIKQLLRQRHRIKEAQEDDFIINNLTAIVQTAASSARALSFLLGIIASISLLVGGIGIMNIMLVSVTERIRAIGIRMAIGARGWDILLQFLLEALMISILGSLVGIATGISGAWLVSASSDHTVVVTAGSIILSFLVAAGIGIFFGFYPARKAARLKPIEALRYE